mmetsp:Transcript_129715/g.193083  ORF Transcript_129715/g.193083 Transcript_129715/m.193083 type:complete len:93 (+) Transcript_129715:311-589(+)
MCTTSIPYFKEIIVMAFTCDTCGYRNTEVKTGGEVGAKGRKIILKVTEDKDLMRDCFKSETCKVIIPEIDFEYTYGSSGGVYSTVEGILEKN